ncbi:MAG: sodium:solute symporter family protein [Rickettsiaceae bacterium]|nr:sodium:solute symporter family protein [Rickettsiaceae bacterium]
MDILIVSIYLFSTLVIGMYNPNKAKTISAYNRIGKDINNNKFILAATIFSSSVGGGTTVGLIEKTYEYDLSFAYGLILAIPVDILIALLIVPRLSAFRGTSSVGEIVSLYYGTGPRMITGIAAALSSIGYVAAQISASGVIFGFILKVDYEYAVIMSSIVLVTYTAIGGLRSIVLNNTLQFIIMNIAIPALAITGIMSIGPQNFLKFVPAEKYDIFSNTQLFWNSICAAISFSVMGFYPSLIQRIVAGRTHEQVTKAIYIKAFVYFLFICFICINGLLATAVVYGAKPSNALNLLIDQVVPAGLKGLVITGLLASVMSTADSDINVASISIVNDILKPLNFFHDKWLVTIAKFVTVIIGSLSIILVLKFKNIVDIVIFSAGLWSPVVVVPIIACLYRKTVSNFGFYLSSFGGTVTFSLYEILYSGSKISGVFVGTVTSLILFMIILNIEKKTTTVAI